MITREQRLVPLGNGDKIDHQHADQKQQKGNRRKGTGDQPETRQRDIQRSDGVRGDAGCQATPRCLIAVRWGSRFRRCIHRLSLHFLCGRLAQQARRTEDQDADQDQECGDVGIISAWKTSLV